MRSDELRRTLTFFRFAEARLQLPVQIVDTDPMPQPRGIIDSTDPIQFANKEVPLMVQADTIWTVDIIPHSDEFTIRIEYLNAMCFAVGDVDIVIAIDDDIMRSDELASIDA